MILISITLNSQAKDSKKDLKIIFNKYCCNTGMQYVYSYFLNVCIFFRHRKMANWKSTDLNINDNKKIKNQTGQNLFELIISIMLRNIIMGSDMIEKLI